VLAVAELLERLHGKRRSHATGTHDNELAVSVGHSVLDVGLELTARNVNRAGNRTLLVFIGLTDIEQRVALSEENFAGIGVDLVDRCLCLLKKFTETGHGRKPTYLVGN